jgi:hypothetical protein
MNNINLFAKLKIFEKNASVVDKNLEGEGRA